MKFFKSASLSFLLGLSIFCASISAAKNNEFRIENIGKFDHPWALEFLPDQKILLTEMRGSLKLLDHKGNFLSDVKGVPEVAFGGQGGLGDIALHPAFEQNQLLYLSYAEASSDNTYGAVVARAKLHNTQNEYQLTELEVIWRQYPKVTGKGHFGHRLLFGPEGYLWISSGERQKFEPSQDMESNLGKMVRLNADGSQPTDNPFSGSPVQSQIWSLGHRNPLGVAFDEGNNLWVVEMGPKGGDELNLVRRKSNFGYPIVSNGDHYSGAEIPDHDTRPEFAAPKITWTPVISPSSMLFYSGEKFPEWKGSLFIGGLSSRALIRVALSNDEAREAERFGMNKRIREVEQGPDGAIWLLEDGRRGSGQLMKLTTRNTDS
ncbi:MAG: PQQ-dependent sugar dehydrogenase [Candidatus Azotimanducaceae bacterium]